MFAHTIDIILFVNTGIVQIVRFDSLILLSVITNALRLPGNKIFRGFFAPLRRTKLAPDRDNTARYLTEC